LCLYQELAPIVSNAEVMPGVYLMRVHTTIASLARPGQFAMLFCDNQNLTVLRRPISIHESQSHVAGFLYAVIGAGTAWLAQRQPGESIDLIGPAGNGFSYDLKSRRLLLIAGGMGIAPLTYLAREATQQGLQVVILAGAKTGQQIYPASLVPPGCQYFTATEDGSAGEKGLVTALLPRHVDWADQVFVCGPLPMFKTLAGDYGLLLKNKSVQVSLEVRMGCGMGFCFACTIQTHKGLQQVCKDGPVFQMSDIIWDAVR
jgi:dihydroorotate dehydrogenase electron transfer subunit